MTNGFSAYTDAFSGFTTNRSSASDASVDLDRKLRKTKNKNRRLKQSIQEQRAAENKRLVEEGEKKEKTTLWESIKKAFVKAVSKIISTAIPKIVVGLVDNFLSRQKKRAFA